jgi:uncharacterized protein with PIN domain
LTVEIVFKGELIELLPLKKRKPLLTVKWNGRRSVKDLVESLCVPHTEVGGIRIHDRWVSFSYILRDGDRVVVLPFCSESAVPGNPISRDLPLEAPVFMCDVHLWKLARRLRLLGLDARFDPNLTDAQLAGISHHEGYILLTRDRGLLIRKAVERGVYVHSTDSEEQVEELLRRLDLYKWVEPFTRYLVCGGFLEPVDLEGQDFETRFKPLIPSGVVEWAKEFHHCPTCEKVFWKGTHYEKLISKIGRYLKKGVEG